MSLSYKRQIAAEKKKIKQERKVQIRETKFLAKLAKLRKQTEMNLAKRDARRSARLAHEEHPLVRRKTATRRKAPKLRKTIKSLFRREW